MDTSIAPGDDFYHYANGAWLKKTEIPADRASYGVWDVLVEQSQQRTKALLEDAGKAAPGSDDRRAGDYYAAYMDEAAIEKRGLSPLTPTLDAIKAIADRKALARWIGQHLRADVDPLNATNFYTDHLFGLWFAQDLNDPAHQIPYVLQGGLGLPDRDYYIESGAEMDRIRSAYKTHIVNILTLAGIPDPAAAATRIYDFERRIAAVHWTRTASADVAKANNHWTRADFDKKAPGLDWAALFDGAGLTGAQTFIVWQPDAITGPVEARGVAAAAVVARVPRVSRGRSQHLGTAESVRRRSLLVLRHGAHGHDEAARSLEARGRLHQRRPRPGGRKDVREEALSTRGEGSAQSDCRQHQRGIRAAHRRADVDVAEDQGERQGQSGESRRRHRLSDSWREYSNLRIERGEAFENAERASLADYEYQRGKLTRAPDRSEWWMDPQTVNALNLPVQNALNFPAAILEPPFYDPAAPAPNNYGAVGAIIGHEISHSFDDTGAQFDATGRFSNWWTPDDLAHFRAAADKLVAQYDAYMPFPDLHLNGKLTLSENIADVAGLSAAYDGYRSQGNATIETDRAFFISFAQAWKSKTREAALRQQVVTDGHAPEEFRASTVRNIDAWYPAFDLKPGQRLYLAAPDRVRVW
jgi:predicted metalloendopeptidase